MLDSGALIAHTTKLELVIRHVLAGLGHGIHAGRERGAGVEFSEYRAYAPGDEWRRVDWKLMARADRYFVREAERDSHVAVWLVLASKARALMHGRLAVTREDIGAMLLPVLAHRVLRNFEAEADGIAIADILAALRDGIRVE